jgi:acetyl esterase/lipase
VTRLHRTSLRGKVSAFAIASLSVIVLNRSNAAGDPGSVPGAEAHLYRSLSPVSLQLYVFKPAGWKATDSRTALIWFHGSGGSPRSAAAWTTWAAGLGIVGVAPEYRQPPVHGTTNLESVADARESLSWIENHASELGVDPHRIVAGGNSAGGFLALWTAISHAPPGSSANESPPIKPAVLLLTSPASDSSTRRLGAYAVALSPIQQLDGKMPPMLVFHGDADKAVPYGNSVTLCAKLAATGNLARLITIKGGSHTYAQDFPSWWPKTQSIALEFLKDQGLVKK